MSSTEGAANVACRFIPGQLNIHLLAQGDLASGNRSEITALIVTYRRADWLERSIRSLQTSAARAGLKISFLIGINGHDPAAQAVAEKLGTKTHVFREPLSPPAARNDLLRSIDAEWVLFIDDDAFVDEGFFTRFLKTRGENPNASVIGGPNLTPPASSTFQKAGGAVLSSRLATFTSSARYRSMGKTRSAGEDGLILCNLFVRAHVLGPDPFPAEFWCGEENWMIQTLSAKNFELIYDPELFVWHERRSVFRDFARQIYRYGFGRGQNISRRPRTTNPFHLVPSLCLLVGAVEIGRWSVQGKPDPFFTVLVFVYVAICMIAAARRSRSIAEWLWAAPLFVVIHIFYGMGLLSGIIHEAME